MVEKISDILALNLSKVFGNGTTINHRDVCLSISIKKLGQQHLNTAEDVRRSARQS